MRWAMTPRAIGRSSSREFTRELEAMSVRVKVARCGNARRDRIESPLVTAGEMRGTAEIHPRVDPMRLRLPD